VQRLRNLLTVLALNARSAHERGTLSDSVGTSMMDRREHVATANS
jgi:hypothetical protein